MLNDVDKEFDLPTEDENGEPIETNVYNDVYEEEEEEVEHDDEFYEANELKATDEQEIDTTAESEEQFNEASEQLKEIYTAVLASGFITEEQLTDIEVLNAQVNEAYDDILGKEKTDIEKLKDRVEELKEGFVGASPDEILNILTENGTKCWLYKDDDDNVLIDGTSIPELTVLVNKFKMIATDGENEGEFTLNPDFIQMVVKDTGTGDAVKSIDNMYYLSTSKYELIGGTWVSILPTSQEQQGKFLWIKTVTTYMDESKQPTETQPICVSSQDGENGADGVDGKDGVSLVYKGEFASHPSNPQNGWYYRNTSEGKTFVYQSGAWYQMTIDGQDGQKGNDGKDGLSIEYKGELKNPPSNPVKNWTYKDPDNGIVYIYTGLAWEVMTYDGNNGTDGTNGTDGLSVFCTYHDSTTKPATPTGNGTLNGWHTNWTSSVVWVSQKVSSDANVGTWGTPIKIQGSDGVSAEEIVTEYAKNTSTTIPPTTGWSTSMPSYQEGYYLWYRTRIKWSNSPNYQYSTPVCDESWKVNAQVYSEYKQLRDKFSWIVKSGTSSSNMELTDKMYSLMTKKVLIEAKKIELNGSIDINNGTFKVATNGNTKIGGLCTHTNSDGTSRGIFEVTSEGTVYSRHKTNQNIYTMLTEGKITVKNDEGTLTFENGQIKVSDGSMATYYGDGYIGHNNSIMVETPRLTCTQKVTATEFTSSMDIVLRSEKSNTTNSDGSTNNDGGSVWLCCAGADVSKTDSRVIRFFKNSNGDYVFRSNSKAGVTYLGTATYPFGNVIAKKLTQTSDRTLKENIAYLSNAISTYNPSGEITIEDCYNFVSNDLPIATYNYVDDCDKKIGFIAQDIIYNADETDNKVGQLIVNPKGYTDEDGKLTYDLGNYVSVLAGALQVAIRKIENLEGTLNGNK